MLAILLLILQFWVGSNQPLPQPAAQATPVFSKDRSPEGVFTEAWLVVRSGFYDPTFGGANWDAVREELLPRAKAAANAEELSAVINEALSRLHASHTHHYTPDQREFYELLDVFYPDGMPDRPGSSIKAGPVEYVGIGLAAERIDGHIFAADVYDGGPADRAGILTGDELLGVEGGPWGDVVPFKDRAGVPTRVTIQRTSEPESRMDVNVTPALIRPHELFLSSLKASARIIERDGKRAAYVRMRSYAHESYQDALKQILAGKFAQEGVPLVFDLRGGWGGARGAYMDIFNPTAPTLTFVNRAGTTTPVPASWQHPVVMLVDGGSRSGKEVLAYAFKKHHVGRLVGEKTAGMVLGGAPRPLADGSVLYLAVANVTVDGEKLEGVGVTPDVVVGRTLPYCAGKDQQIDAAVREANRMSSPAAVP